MHEMISEIVDVASLYEKQGLEMKSRHKYLSYIETDLLCGIVIRCYEDISLTVNCRISTSSYGIHLPTGVHIIHNVEIPKSASATIPNRKRRRRKLIFSLEF